jgi:ribosomal protein S18 acetylase RimI-like enzyme
MIYLHVARYNEIGQRFYKRNGFRQGNLLEGWYEIFGKEYDAIAFYKEITNGESDKNSELD